MGGIPGNEIGVVTTCCCRRGGGGEVDMLLIKVDVGELKALCSVLCAFVNKGGITGIPGMFGVLL